MPNLSYVSCHAPHVQLLQPPRYGLPSANTFEVIAVTSATVITAASAVRLKVVLSTFALRFLLIPFMIRTSAVLDIAFCPLDFAHAARDDFRPDSAFA